MTSNSLPSEYPGGALTLARNTDGSGLSVKHNYTWPPIKMTRQEAVEST